MNSYALDLHQLDTHRLDLHKLDFSGLDLHKVEVALQIQIPRTISDHDIYVSNVGNM